ncbi:MAG: hypothetical protein MR656_03315 [Bacteroidales bacterium]|nr:hypothetical protein [Bacteroidales bacterium]
MACLISSRGLNQPHHITNAALPSEGGGIAKRIKTARLRRKTNLQKSDYPKTRIKRDPNALCVLEYDNLYLLQIINIQCIILIIGGREISRPYQNVGYRLEKFDAAFFTNKSFYHQGFFAVKRRAVFYVFVFYSIHDSATMHNLSPQIFH